MPSTFCIDSERFIVHAVASGVVTLEDAFDLMKAINEHPDYQKGMGTLLDMRNTRVMVKMDQLITLGDAVKRLIKIRGRVGIAILTDSDLTFGMGRMVGSTLSDEDVQVSAFRHEKEAVAWLHEVAVGSGYYRRPTGETD